MRFGIVIFPNTWSYGDYHNAVHIIMRQEARYVWHKDTDLRELDCVILPGGFSYSDYFRLGVITRFSTLMSSITDFADKYKLPLIKIGVTGGNRFILKGYANLSQERIKSAWLGGLLK